MVCLMNRRRVWRIRTPITPSPARSADWPGWQWATMTVIISCWVFVSVQVVCMMSIWWWIACCTVREDGESGPQSLHHQQDKPCRPHRQWATVTLMILYWVFVSTQVFCMMSMWRWFACCTDGEGRESGPWSLHHQQDQPGGLGWQWATVPGADHWRETQGKIAFKQCMDGWLIGSLVYALDCILWNRGGCVVH